MKRNVAYLLLLTILVALTAIRQAQATLPQPPVDIEMRFPTPHAELGAPQTVLVSITPTMDIPDVLVEVAIPEGVAKIDGEERWAGSMVKGEPVTLSLRVSIEGPGRYTLTALATLRFSPKVVFTKRETLNLIATPQGVEVSARPFPAIDFERGRIPVRDGAAPLPPLEPADESSTEGFSAPESRDPSIEEHLNDILREKMETPDLEESSGAPRRNPGAAAGTVAFKAEGSVSYRDANGTAHPIRLIQVTAWDTSSSSAQKIGTGKTDLDGKFLFRIVTTSALPKIELRFHAHGPANIIAVVGPEKGVFWYSASPAYTLANVKKGVLSVKLQTGIPVPNSPNDSLTARIFSVYDAMVTGTLQGWKLVGDVWMKRVGVSVVFPNTTTASNEQNYYDGSDVTIYIGRDRALCWDILLHEYGHFFADKGARKTADIDQSPGGLHNANWGSAIGIDGKDREGGLWYGWSEGFATAFAIACQKFPVYPGSLPSIPLAGDTVFHLTEDGASFFEMESPDGWFGMDGYAAEASVAAALFDVLDKHSDSLPQSTAADLTQVGFLKFWQLINLYSGSKNVCEFYNTLMRTNTRGLAGRLATTNLFVINNIAPRAVAPAPNAKLPKSVPIAFEWTQAGDPNPLHRLDQFTVLLYRINAETKDFELVKATGPVSGVTYTYTTEEWNEILKAIESDKPKTQYSWFVMGWNDSGSPRIPPLPRDGEPELPGGVQRTGFLSNTNRIELAGTVVINPPAMTLGMNRSQQFTAVVEGVEDQRVLWSVKEGDDGGKISEGGLYTAPAHAGKYTVVATSVADPNLEGTAPITVLLTVQVSGRSEVVCGDTGMPDMGPVTFTAVASGGVEPYTYEWNLEGEIKTGSPVTYQIGCPGCNDQDWSACSLMGTDVYVKATDAAGNTGSGYINWGGAF